MQSPFYLLQALLPGHQLFPLCNDIGVFHKKLGAPLHRLWRPQTEFHDKVLLKVISNGLDEHQVDERGYVVDYALRNLG